jgi:hypothetical protein
MSKCIIHLPGKRYIDCGWDRMLGYYYDYYPDPLKDPVIERSWDNFSKLHQQLVNSHGVSLAMVYVPQVPNKWHHIYQIMAIVPVDGTGAYELRTDRYNDLFNDPVMMELVELSYDDNGHVVHTFSGELLPTIIKLLQREEAEYEIF